MLTNAIQFMRATPATGHILSPVKKVFYHRLILSHAFCLFVKDSKAVGPNRGGRVFRDTPTGSVTPPNLVTYGKVID